VTFRPRLLAAATACLCAALPAHAIELIARGSLSGTASDLSGQSSPLENGVAGNLLGGIGSGLAWAGGNTFLALPDRGPNATAYNSAVDDTASYIARFQTMTLALTASAPGAALPFTLTPTLSATTLLSSTAPLAYGSGAGLGNKLDGTPLGSGAPALNASTGRYYFTGRSDNYASSQLSTFAANGRLDPEAIRVSADGKSVYISDEYGPYVYEFNRATGVRTRTFTVPANLAISHLSPVGATEISGNTTGRVANKGMEGLAITPDGKTLVGIMQAPLEQDAGKNLRIVTFDVATGQATGQYGYKLTTGSGVSEIVALNDHEFLVDERDGNGIGGGAGAKAVAVVKQIFKIDIKGATDVSSQTGTLTAVPKTLVLDVVKALGAKGIAANQIPSKLEGLAFGQDVVLNGVTTHTLYVANDNDFNAVDPDTGMANPNQWFVFGVTDAELGTKLVAQAVPEPGSWALMLAGLAGVLALSRRRRSAVPVR
jgi:hypothetical protein